MIANDISNDNFENHHYSSALLRMIKGLEEMILNAPDNAKKEMLVDVLNYSKEVATRIKNNVNSVNYLLVANHELEVTVQSHKLQAAKDKLRIKILEAHLKAALPIEEFNGKLEQLK